MKTLIEQLRDGEIAVENDGTLEELKRILKVAFPNDNWIPLGTCKYYYKSIKHDGDYQVHDYTRLKPIRVKEFIKELNNQQTTTMKTTSKYSEVKIDHTDDNGVAHIDAYLTEDSNEGGRVLGYIVKGEVYWVDHDARFDPLVMGVVREYKSNPLDTLEKLTKAMELMKEAKGLVSEARNENESLSEYYGYCLTIIEQQLSIFADNNNRYITGNTTLEEIINNEGSKWENQ